MAGIDYTVDSLIADVKRTGAIPTHQSLFDEGDFVNVLSDDMKTILVPLIMGCQENHFLTYKDYSIVSGTQRYTIPWRAVGNKLKAVKIVEGGKEIQTLARIDLRDLTEDSIGNIVKIAGFRLEGTDVILWPDDNWAGKTLRLYYYRRPNDLCEVAESGKVVSINTGTGEVQLDNVPTDWTTSNTFDVIRPEPPFKAIAEEISITGIAGLVLTFSLASAALMAVGDYISIKGQSPIAQIPYDAYPLLTARGVCAVLGALSPQAGEQAEKSYANLHQMYVTIISPRVDDAPKKLVNRKGIWQGRGIQKWPS